MSIIRFDDDIVVDVNDEDIVDGDVDVDVDIGNIDNGDDSVDTTIDTDFDGDVDANADDSVADSDVDIDVDIFFVAIDNIVCVSISIDIGIGPDLTVFLLFSNFSGMM